MRPDSTDGDVSVERDAKARKARRYCVVFYNDNYTTKWFVVLVLQQFFRMSEGLALSFMLTVHKLGKGVAGVYSRDIAETKAKQVTDFARENGMPLLVTAEPEDDGDEPSDQR